jgi:hypothetical protein
VTAVETTKSALSSPDAVLRLLASGGWPLAGLILALIVNAAWVGFLGYLMLKLV